MSQLLIYILNIIASIVLIAFVARFLAQLGRADFNNPLAQTVFSITNPILKPLRRLIPSFSGLDIASLVSLYLGQFIFASLVLTLSGRGGEVATPDFFVWTVLSLAGIFIMVIKWSMIIVAVASFILAGQYNPFIHFISQMIEPFIAPFRRLNLQIGVLDLSFIIAIMVLHIINLFILLPIAAHLGVPIRVFIGL